MTDTPPIPTKVEKETVTYKNHISLSQSGDDEDSRGESGSKAERCF